MHGGHFDSYQTSRTTHFVCDVFPNAKLKQLRKPKRTGIRYVTTQWVLKSIESRCRAPEAEFLPKGLAGQHGVGIASFVRSSHDSVPTSSDSESASIPRSLPPTLATESAQAAPTSLPPQHGTSNQPSRRVTSDDPDFIHNYFESSRLHFIGSWRARLPALLASVESESTLDEYEQMNDATYTSGNGDERVVLHVDMDCFFVSVLLRGRETEFPDGTPVAVAHSKGAGSSEVSSCNYAARARGVSAGTFMSTAKERCPELRVVHYDFKQYEEVSEQIYRIFFSTVSRRGGISGGALKVQPVSVDEAFIEYPTGRDGLAAAADLRQRIHGKTGCTASVGVGPNMLIARLATKKAKPDGQHRVMSVEMREFLSKTLLKDLPGVGWRLGRNLSERGYTTCEELWPVPEEALQEWFGRAMGRQLFNWCRGRDDRELTPVAERKSIGAEVNWGLRFTEVKEVEVFLSKLSDEVSKRLEEACVKGRTITLKLKKRKADADAQTAKYLGHGRCDNMSKSVTVQSAMSSGASISSRVIALFRTLQSRVPPEDVRGLGIQVSRLQPLVPNKHKPTEPQDASLRHWVSTRVADSCAASSEAESISGRGHVRVQHEDSSNSSSATVQSESQGEYLVPSQVDPSVLDALPADIQRAVARSRGRKRKSLASLAGCLDDRTECIGEKVQNRRMDNAKEIGNRSIDTADTIVSTSTVGNGGFSLSQQAEFLSSMPPELMDEVWQEMCASYQQSSSSRLEMDGEKKSGMKIENYLTSECSRQSNDSCDMVATDSPQHAGDGLGRAPSELLPHLWTGVDALEETLEQW
eukprot:CAMPEP_0185041080 /NCGR_PEP_ID=MMETSP1103-20130426/39917_1 /TAXON_ID=36769 /ORGANISM="Paraphysomonas bandaiensis, Strain Caron Lab Isolate" /LENGTH=810 /DNA_ID=CAMNT_0027580659 /DNA_START=77 /DNA_END=2506 /DNA_ORIENTATION=-